jgi:carboxypeptidase Q
MAVYEEACYAHAAMRALVLTISLVATACAPTAKQRTGGLPEIMPVPNSPAKEIACSLSDEVGARLAGSKGDAKAVAWAVEKMKALGLSNVRAEPVKVRHWERGEASAELVAPFQKKLIVAALGSSESTPAGGLEAEVVRVGSLDELKNLPDERVKGRIVFFDKVMERSISGEGYGKTVDVRSRGAMEAEKKGAVASIIRSVGTSDARFPHTGNMRASKLPALALAIPDAEVLRRAVQSDKGPVRLRLSTSSHFVGEAESANVIGEVPGIQKPEEIVLLGAHLDSWDLGDGAVDDAAGVGVVLDVASQLVARPLDRTVRVVLFANEENGLKGAEGYAAKYKPELGRHVVALEVDSGAGRALGVRFQAGPGATEQLQPLQEPLDKLSLTIAADPEAGGADSGELEGVPLLQIVQDNSRYFDVHHTADDTCDKIVEEELAHVTSVATMLVRHVGRSGVDLGRRPAATKQ